MAAPCGTPYNTGMLNEVAYSTIPFERGQATLRVFNDHDPRVARGIDAQWNYDGHCQHFHIWNTAFGFESSAEVEYTHNAHRKALSQWLLEQGILADTLVLLHTAHPCGA